MRKPHIKIFGMQLTVYIEGNVDLDLSADIFTRKSKNGKIKHPN